MYGLGKTMKLKYRDISDFKYQVVDEYRHQTDLKGMACRVELLELTDSGLLIVSPGYLSDGPSGPTFDDMTNLRAAIGWHDPMAQLMRMGCVDEKHLPYVNSEFYRVLLEDGMDAQRAENYLWGVTHPIFSYSKPGTQKPDPVHVVGRE